MGPELVGYTALREGFFESLSSSSVFFRLLGDGSLARVPLRVRVGVSSANATGWIAGKGRPVPLTKLNLAAPVLEPVLAAALIVVTGELLQATGRAAEAAFGRELRNAVAAVVDREFFGQIGTGITPQAATASATDDLETLLDLVNTTGTGTLYWAMTPSLANHMATMTAGSGGARLFAEMSPSGGSLVGLPALVSNQVPAGGGSPALDALWLIDAAGIAADAEQIGVSMSRQADIEMDAAPGQDAVAGTGASMVSLWQSNSAGLMAKVTFAAERFRPTAVVVLEGVGW